MHKAHITRHSARTHQSLGCVSLSSVHARCRAIGASAMCSPRCTHLCPCESFMRHCCGWSARMHLLHAHLSVGFAAILSKCTKAESVVTPNKRTSLAAGLEATNKVLAGHAQRGAADGDAARRRSSHHSQRSFGQEQVQFASAVDIAVDVFAMPAAIGCCACIHTCHALACLLCSIAQSHCQVNYRPKHGAK